MTTVTIPKKEYQDLIEKKFRYEHLKQILEEDIFSPPPVNNTKEIVEALKQTKRYGKKFIESVKNGLRRSSYFR